LQVSQEKIGVDLGLNHFIATSNGEMFVHPKPLKSLTTKRRKLARNLSKKSKKSKNKEKVRLRLARTDERISNIRDNFSWQVCNSLLRKYGTFYVENLNIKAMQKNRHLSKSIADVSWNSFLLKLSYKAESAGRTVMKVNPRNTSQECSKCGKIVKKSLSTRIHHCLQCGLKIDRDINAARNILSRGKIGREPSDSMPVGDGTSTNSEKLMVSSVKESGKLF